MVLFLAGLGAEAAADAPIGIDGHDPFMFGGVVILRRVGGDQDLLGDSLGGLGHRGGQHAGHRRAEPANHAAPGKVVLHGTSEGLCGTWHSVHLDPV